ncbi:unnamed protein product [Mycena citricolor]|uniref:Tail specific protease domain-containing protein n=1 Tax=Mycena citricolor TaxID=2018698 RepID=A0AAD2Q290_9AGAR|nr:unnamed protein product [Mycena citricolor]CAK5273511.1 unnamed protein product [Mycena citricolor]
MGLFSLLVLVAAAAAPAAKASDPCTLATTATWVSSSIAHACELSVPFNQTRSLAVMDSVLKALPYYSLETWFERSPNPLIPHAVDLRSLLQDVQHTAAQGGMAGYQTDWDFNIAVSEAFNREQDGHTSFVASCTQSFSWNLPFSIASLADSPSNQTTYPVFLANYDFPNQNRSGLEEYFQGLNVSVREFDGARILSIDGVEAGPYLLDLAANSSIYDGLQGAYETLDPRYMRLMSRYSADTDSGLFTQELGKFAQRMFYPGSDSVTVEVLLANGTSQLLTVPWAASFVGADLSFCSDISGETRRRGLLRQPSRYQRRKAVVAPDTQAEIRTKQHTPVHPNYVQPNLTSFGHFLTLDIYQLQEHKHVGVVYLEQFEPPAQHDYQTYSDGISKTIHSGLVELKKAGVRHILLDVSGNRGGFISTGALALRTLWPKDRYPGFPAVFRVSDLIRREAECASEQNNSDSEYFFGNYLSGRNERLTSNAQFMDPPVKQIVNGIPDAYSHPILDNFDSIAKTFDEPPFADGDYVIVSNGICASTCSIFTSYLFQKHGVRSAVFGAQAEKFEFDGGIKGSEITSLDDILSELDTADLADDPAAPQALPVSASLTLNFRNAIPYEDETEDKILEFVWEQGTKGYQYTKEMFNNPERVWEFVAGEFFG